MATQFDFSNLGSMFGGGMGGTPSGLDALLSEDQRKLMGRNAALSAAAALLQAGGRSPQRIGLGQALGSALQAGQQGYQQARAGSLQDLLLGQKLQEAKTAQDLQKQIAGVFTEAPPMLSPQQQALMAPNMQLGPTNARAELAANIPPPSADELLASQYRRAAQIATSAGKGEDAKRFMDIAKELRPVEEYSTTPQFGNSAGGTPISFVLSKSGNMKLLNFNRSPEFNYQDTGSYISVRDKNTNKELERIPKSMTPGEVASNVISQGNLAVNRGNLGIAQRGLGLREAEFARNAFEIKDTPDGLMYVPKAVGGAAMPVMGAGGTQLEGTGAKPTEDQSKSAGFAFRMQESTKIFNQPVTGVDGQPIIDPKTNKPITLEEAFGRPGRFQAIMRSIPSAGLTTGVANVFETSGRQQYRQAQENWVTANLRPESGAVIGAEEMEKEITKYFPQVSDSPETIAQKSRARRDTQLAVKVRAGPAFKQLEKMVAEGQSKGPRLERGADGLLRYVTE